MKRKQSRPPNGKAVTLKPDPRNARHHSDHNKARIRQSLELVGAGRGLLADGDNIIRAGNGVYETAKQLGYKFKVVDVAPDELLVSRRADLHGKEAERAAMLDNLASDTSAWDYEADRLAELVRGDDVLQLIAREEAQLRELLRSANGGGAEISGDASATLARAEALQKIWEVAHGQIWQCGRHRLMCGDAYCKEDMAALLDGAKPDMLHTDPPYGINIVKPKSGRLTAAIGGSKPFGSISNAKRKSGVAFRDAQPRPTVPVGRGCIVQSNLYPVIQGDDRPFDPAPFLNFAPIIILWGANNYASKLPDSQCWIVWDKREDITRNTFADCELAWCNQKASARLFHHLWSGLYKGSQYGERRTHPTEKPIALFEEIGKLFCSEGLWLDLFAGTGAQIIAAERCGTTCYACDVEPLYVAVALQRLQDTCGLTPRRVT